MNDTETMLARCEHCRAKIRAPLRLIGSRRPCPKCKVVTHLTPADEEAAAAVDDAPAETPQSEWPDAMDPPTETEAETVPEASVAPPPVPASVPAPAAAPAADQPQRPQFRCPYCASNRPPTIHRVTSNAGLIFAVVLFLALCLPLFWLGFLIREDRYYCSTCGMRLR